MLAVALCRSVECRAWRRVGNPGKGPEQRVSTYNNPGGCRVSFPVGGETTRPDSGSRGGFDGVVGVRWSVGARAILSTNEMARVPRSACVKRRDRRTAGGEERKNHRQKHATRKGLISRTRGGRRRGRTTLHTTGRTQNKRLRRVRLVCNIATSCLLCLPACLRG